MTANRRRDRLVYFRISEEEFAQMTLACDVKGARSLSDLARTAVREFIGGSPAAAAPPEPQVVNSIEALRALVHELKDSVQQLVAASAGADDPVSAPHKTKAPDRVAFGMTGHPKPRGSA